MGNIIASFIGMNIFPFILAFLAIGGFSKHRRTTGHLIIVPILLIIVMTYLMGIGSIEDTDDGVTTLGRYIVAFIGSAPGCIAASITVAVRGRKKLKEKAM